jgi:flagellar biosynthesis protein FlhA
MRHFALPGGILALILLMIVPISSVLLDVFFVLNIALSISILMAAINARKPLDFSAFPTVLLFATLLRLALNVASTRIVLVHGHEGTSAAGHVIEAFGAFLIGGNFIVGIFVFAILLIINLVVVTKGAGRVSEVSARFTLDALPGKQMAIDADLAAGLLTPDGARARRKEVATEADFYGSMDGASKFVKGDAIAALLILAVNVVAGFCLGMISHGLTAGEAAQHYITLAVGDALVAQVPSLLLSIAAAAIVTRVSDDDDLTGQIGSQFANPAIWVPVSLILGAIGLIPAMPQTVFLPAAGIAGYLAWTLAQRAKRPAIAAEIAPIANPHEINLDDVSDHTLVSIEIGFGLVHLVDDKRSAPLLSRITGVRKQLSQTFGFVVPQVRVRDSLDLGPTGYRVLVGGVVAGKADIRPDKLLAINAGEANANPAIHGEPTRDPSFGCEALWIEAGLRDLAIAEGFIVVDASTVIATHLNQLLIERPQSLLGPDEVLALVEGLKERAAGLVETVYPQPLPLAALTRLLRSLLEEGISIAHLVPIFNSLSAGVQQTTEHDRLIDLLRMDLGPYITGRICGPNDKLPVITLDGELEAMILQGVVDPATNQPIIEPDLARSIAERVAEILDRREPDRRACALVVQPRVRRPMAALLKLRAPQCLVISINELAASQPIEVVAIVGGASEPAAPTSPTMVPQESLAA